MIQIGLNVRMKKGGIILLFLSFLSCSVNRNVSIHDLNNVETRYSKLLVNKTYNISFYSLGGKKYTGFNFNKIDNKYGKKEVFLIMNTSGDNLVYEGLFKIKNYNSYLYNLSRYSPITENKTVKIYDESELQVLDYYYTTKKGSSVSEYIFKYNNDYFSYMVQISKRSDKLKYKLDKYINQSIEGLILAEKK